MTIEHGQTTSVDISCIEEGKHVLVDWLDSSGSNFWQEIEHARGRTPMRCKTSGWVVTTFPLTIATHLALDDSGNVLQVDGIMTIPLGCIQGVEELGFHVAGMKI